jgi:hypothetical protein
MTVQYQGSGNLRISNGLVFIIYRSWFRGVVGGDWTKIYKTLVVLIYKYS